MPTLSWLCVIEELPLEHASIETVLEKTYGTAAYKLPLEHASIET